VIIFGPNPHLLLSLSHLFLHFYIQHQTRSTPVEKFASTAKLWNSAFSSKMALDDLTNLQSVPLRRDRSITDIELSSDIKYRHLTTAQYPTHEHRVRNSQLNFRPLSFTSTSVLLGIDPVYPNITGSPFPAPNAHIPSLLKRHNLVPPSDRHRSISPTTTNTTSTTLNNRGKDPLELVYNLTTSTFRQARRSTLLPADLTSSRSIPSSSTKYNQQPTHTVTLQPIFRISERYPPLLIDGRKKVMSVPRWTIEIEIYWRRGLDVRERNGNASGKGNGREKRKTTGETEVLVRKVKLPRKIWVERNALGLWSELWVERV
jgi:hypothetical protein